MSSLRTVETGLLRVARPRECNTQQIKQKHHSDATTHATGAQQTGLKALALQALSRNTSATPAQQHPKNPRNKALFADDELLRVAEPVECNTQQPEQAYQLALEASAQRMRGVVPACETARALCAHCGPVWVHPNVAAVAPVVNGWARLLGCPWCHVRWAGGYVPRPPRGSYE